MYIIIREDEDDYSDDEDMSWKVRRSCAKCLAAIVQVFRINIYTSHLYLLTNILYFTYIIYDHTLHLNIASMFVQSDENISIKYIFFPPTYQ